MKVFATLINIDDDLRDFFGELERYFLIKIDNNIIERIFKDAKEDKVSEKRYEIFRLKRTLFKSKMMIVGKVDEYEPETIGIEIQNIKNKDLNYLKNWIDDYGTRAE